MQSRQPVSIRLQNGDLFSGNLNQNNTSMQDGQYIFANEDKYNGDIFHGMKHGFGVYHYARTGERY